MQNGGGAEANVANLQTFMDDFVCAANTNNTGYFFFEFMDEPWKTVQYGGVEGYWGVFDQKFVVFTFVLPVNGCSTCTAADGLLPSSSFCVFTASS